MCITLNNVYVKVKPVAVIVNSLVISGDMLKEIESSSQADTSEMACP